LNNGAQSSRTFLNAIEGPGGSTIDEIEEPFFESVYDNCDLKTQMELIARNRTRVDERLNRRVKITINLR